RYEKVAMSEKVRFVGNVMVGRDISVPELRELDDAVVLATGAPKDRQLGIPGEHLGNVFGSAAFVGWYNGHPEFARLAPDLSGKTAIVIGMGNVALDVARILAKTRSEFVGSDIVAHALDALQTSRLERIVILGRRRPHQLSMTPQDMGELGSGERAAPRVSAADRPAAEAEALPEPGLRKWVAHLRTFAAAAGTTPATSVTIDFVFMSSPKSLVGQDKVEAS